MAPINISSTTLPNDVDPIAAINEVLGPGASRADRRRALAELKRQFQYNSSGFRKQMQYAPTEGSRSKYEPHIGEKEKGRHA